MADDTRPNWARRLSTERRTRGWTQQRTIDALRMHSERALPDDTNLLRMWKNWESGKHKPRKEYQLIIASMFATASAAIFGPNGDEGKNTRFLAQTTPEITIELVERIRRSDLDAASLDTMSITVERLCSEYASMPSAELHREGMTWLAQIVPLLDSRVSLEQHRELLVLSGWLTLLLGCVEYDSQEFRTAESTRRAAFILGKEADHAGIMAWAQEMSCWFALTQGNYRQVIEAARIGTSIAPHHSVSVQLAAQEAKAWARMGDRHQVELALERGRLLLESLPYPDNIDNHFNVDPDKFDFYAMDCYRKTGEDVMADMLANEVITKATLPDGSMRSPMRIAEAKTTLAVSSARQGSLDGAIEFGTQALTIPRQSVPSLLMVTSELVTELRRWFPGEPEADAYLEHRRSLARAAQS
jgi:hypothetical protein